MLGKNIKVGNIYGFPKKAGVYLFTNKANGKRYVGKANNLQQRASGYRNAVKGDNSQPILRAFRVHGFEGFDMEILELYPMGTNSEFLVDREEFYIKEWGLVGDNGYNCYARGNDVTGYKFSDEVKKKMSEAKKGDKAPCWRIPKELHPCYGMRHSEEMKKKWSDDKKGIPNNHLKKPIIQLDKITEEFIAEWPSARDAARGLFHDKTKSSGISMCCSGTCPSAYGFKWKFKTQQ